LAEFATSDNNISVADSVAPGGGREACGGEVGGFQGAYL